MAFGSHGPDGFDKQGQLSPMLAACLALCLTVLVVLPGCGGCSCRKSPPKSAAQLEKERKDRLARLREEEKKKKPNVEFGDFVSLPYEPRSGGEERQATACFYKPGHWTSTVLSAKANHFDIKGSLETAAVSGGGRNTGLTGVPYSMSSSRSAPLPKGQPKSFRCVLFAPVGKANAMVVNRLASRKGTRGTYEKRDAIQRMPPYQYNFVVLARYPENYSYVKGLDSVKRPSELDFEDLTQGDTYYRVQLLKAQRRAALPSYGLFWTSTACVLWDDANPDALTLDQQVAMLDWLHWGGQLIISGPESLDALRDSFLAEYLPAESVRSRDVSKAELAQLNEAWTIAVRKQPRLPLTAVRPWSAVELKKHPAARFVAGTGNLLVERNVGRGRIVVSAFGLSNPDLLAWPSFDGFFNACLLRRPCRVFDKMPDSPELYVTWAEPGGKPNLSRQFDSRMTSKLRYFSRDTGYKHSVTAGSDGGIFPGGYETPEVISGGVGSWSDFNSVATSSRHALQRAAQIEIPEASFVAWVVSGYLLVLVPMNWLVFRLIGRVEWAWVAAPVVAIACTAIVIRLAQLDIGFARSRTEVATLELHADYPRAHVARYTVMYSSLTTKYRIGSEDPGAQIQPFPTVDKPEHFSLQMGERLTNLRYLFGKDAWLEGLRIASNSTGYAHTEQMVDTGGTILLKNTAGLAVQVINRTNLTVEDAGVVRMTESGELEAAWIGRLEPEATARPVFRPASTKEVKDGIWPDRRDQSELTASGAPPGELNIRELVELAEDCRELRPGDVRLVGWTEEKIPGMEVKPAAPQSRTATVVIAHLAFGPGEGPKRDFNTRYDYTTLPRSMRPETAGDESTE
jgi:hypothetical protein